MTTKPTFMALFRYSCIRKITLIKSAMSLLDILLYYNLTYSSILIGKNPYVSFLSMAAMEFPVRIIGVIFVNYMKRRTSYVVLYGFTALCSLSAIFLPKDPWWLQLSFVICAKLHST
uniref:Putative organic cation/carnitine transporter n=1 Tax=Ixodes ricinus TaxID=34613 RepID=A0A0K8R636_IXORI